MGLEFSARTRGPETMPWKRMDVDEERMRFVIRAVSGQERLAGLCREFEISRPTGYLWRQRYRESGSLADLAEHSRRPQRSPGRTAGWKAQRVVALRQQTGWGAKKLRVLLREEQQLDLPVRTIHRILERHELLRAPSHGAAPQRFQRSTPNELWQMDSKGKYPLRDGQCHALSILDDHSRYAVGLYALPTDGGAGASLPGADVSPLWRAAGHVNGSWLAVVGDDQRLGIDLAVAAADRTRDSLAVRTGGASADAGEGGALSSHAGGSAAASRSAGEICGVACGAGGMSMSNNELCRTPRAMQRRFAALPARELSGAGAANLGIIHGAAGVAAVEGSERRTSPLR